MLQGHGRDTPKEVGASGRDADEDRAYHFGKGSTAVIAQGFPDPDFQDALLLNALEWRPARWDDIESIPARVLRLLLAYRAGVAARSETHGKFGTIGDVPVR